MKRKILKIYLKKEKVSKEWRPEGYEWIVRTKYGSKRTLGYAYGTLSKQRANAYVKDLVDKWSWRYIIYLNGKKVSK
jgi:hypothetical protein